MLKKSTHDKRNVKEKVHMIKENETVFFLFCEHLNLNKSADRRYTVEYDS